MPVMRDESSRRRRRRRPATLLCAPVVLALLASALAQPALGSASAAARGSPRDGPQARDAAATEASADAIRALGGPEAAAVFAPPVDAPVSAPFSLPYGQYGAGNRGIEYETRPGQVVRAAAPGAVSFAGAVAGSLYVTVDHGGGVLSSYSYLSRLSVREGDQVLQGRVVGLAGEMLQFGVRVDGEYVDPAVFTARRRVIVRLVKMRARRIVRRVASEQDRVALSSGSIGSSRSARARP